MNTNPLFTLAQAGDTLSFATDGTVTVSGKTTTGTWRTDATGKNSIQYTLAGAAPVDLPVTYALNADNQLVLAIPASAAAQTQAVAPITLQGRILVEENKHLTYYLIQDDGWDVQTNLAFYVYGTVLIDPANNQLTITPDAGAPLVLSGHASTGTTALSVGQGDNSLDLIQFSAITHNPLAGGGSADADADICVILDFRKGKAVVQPWRRKPVSICGNDGTGRPQTQSSLIRRGAHVTG